MLIKTNNFNIQTAHDQPLVVQLPLGPLKRLERENIQDQLLSSNATRALGSGERKIPEEADEFRTCFERDKDRILHSSAFRRLAGKTQVFTFPKDHQRTRLTHALEVAQVGSSIAKATRLNVDLTQAIALGHDCGHAPGGHAGEKALSDLSQGEFDHAIWGADVALLPLNLCKQTLDGIRNHSWSRPTPSSLEAEVVSWADRIAYCCHDLEDALTAGIVQYRQIPQIILDLVGPSRNQQLNTFIGSVIDCMNQTGIVGMKQDLAQALDALKQFNTEQIYLRPASKLQSKIIYSIVTALVQYFSETPSTFGSFASPGSKEATEQAINYVSGMTDRFAFDTASQELGWDMNLIHMVLERPTTT